MKLVSLKTNPLNQNNYNRNALTPEFVGSLVIYPVDITPEKCLPCDGYKLKKADYAQLYAVIGNKYNDGTEAADEFRIPDYNITGEFLQPSTSANKKIAAGLPNITGRFDGNGNDGTQHKTGCFYQGAGVSGSDGAQGGAYIHLDASRSSSIYGKSKTVQPPARTVKVCIRYK